MKKVRLQEQEQYREFIQRLFPDIKITTETSQEKWLENVESAIEKHIVNIQETKSGDVSKLQAELKYYKSIIDDTVRPFKENSTSVFISLDDVFIFERFFFNIVYYYYCRRVC